MPSELKPCPFCGGEMEDRGYGAVHLDPQKCPIGDLAVDVDRWNRRADLCASGQQVRAAAHRILELYDDALRDLLAPDVHDEHPDSDELAELRKIVGAPAHRWTPASTPATPTAQEAVAWAYYWPDGGLMDVLTTAVSPYETLRQAPLYAHPPLPSETVAEPRVICLPYPMHGYGVCVGGRYDGWLMWQHLDGQWVTKSNLESVDPRALSGGDNG
ncbi:Lar family restriction alleviation protein [Paracoccus denitrificans]|jgi:hypothetical protein|uniref:Uncharacterized protein n=1 Tax=Paracoccus denitrificans (strain Pd 1222) TaxID=318586 RepID=A1B8F8_PARDP|nr:Lar family restriction alleviation protein [Paracoccus denitrificans]ABL71802.1 hypothetical protein Pden_3735 [Paracoccus denitrificans PD1222]MBB4628100.1 hypothetical protein [Paracoccus denitrificans]MCU7429165.1 Lar family restriction alleviation protein [Paracoccus denitrificans]QAR28387.1 hypothetical protein EO213_18970 [Paracoccus denitrificans]UPV96523.1 Lar family restriction alleviation protein [Paracoccus denitrificans]